MDIRTYYEEQRGLMCTAMRESLPYLRRLLRMDAEQFAAVLGIHEQELADIEAGGEELGATVFLAIAAVLDDAVREMPEIAVRIETILSLNAPEDEGFFDHLGTISLTQRWLDIPHPFRDTRMGSYTGLADGGGLPHLCDGLSHLPRPQHDRIGGLLCSSRAADRCIA